MPSVFDSILLGQMEVKNRLVAAPMVINYATEEGHVTPELVRIYEEKAKGGFGLVVVEASTVHPSTNNFARMLGVYHDSQIPGLNQLAEAIQRWGAKASIQLQHGGRQSNPILSRGHQPVAPSATSPPWGGVTPRELTTAECEEVIDWFAAAAARAQAAGFDSVLFHFTHGFLPQEFMSPYTNKRTDKYGERLRFVTEIIQRSRERVGKDFSLGARIPGDEMLGEAGITVEMMAKKLAPGLVETGLDYLDVTVGVFETIGWVIPPLYFQRGTFFDMAREIKRHVGVPVIGGGRVFDPKLARKAVEQGWVDMVFLGRAHMADPEFPKKMLEGREEEIRKCIACDACTDRLFKQWQVKCAVNPAVGNPQYATITPASKRKRVVVVGGGVGGMQAAFVAHQRGHEVILYEKSPDLGGISHSLGGLCRMAASIPRLYTRELRNIVDWLISRLTQAEVQVKLGHEFTPEVARQLDPDAVILSVGSSPVLPPVPGIDRPFVCTIDEYLRGTAGFSHEVPVGKRVAVIGGAHGAEVAVSLAREGREVFLLSEGEAAEIGAAPYITVTRLTVLHQYLAGEEQKLRLLTQTKVQEIARGGVRYADKTGREEEIAVDSVIVATARKPNRDLALRLKGLALELYEVGDCREPRRILDAVHQATAAAWNL